MFPQTRFQLQLLLIPRPLHGAEKLEDVTIQHHEMLNPLCLLLPAKPKMRYMQFPRRCLICVSKEKDVSARTAGRFSDEIKSTFKEEKEKIEVHRVEG